MSAAAGDDFRRLRATFLLVASAAAHARGLLRRRRRGGGPASGLPRLLLRPGGPCLCGRVCNFFLKLLAAFGFTPPAELCASERCSTTRGRTLLTEVAHTSYTPTPAVITKTRFVPRNLLEPRGWGKREGRGYFIISPHVVVDAFMIRGLSAVGRASSCRPATPSPPLAAVYREGAA